MNFNETIKRLQSAEGDPEKLTLATVDVVLMTHDPQLRVALDAAAVPHWFDGTILSALLGDEVALAEETLKKLCSLPWVESFGSRGGWNVNAPTRLALRNRLANNQPDRFFEFSARAANHFKGSEPFRQIEATYHRLIAQPDDGATELARLYRAWVSANRSDALQATIIAVEELLRDDRLAPMARAWHLLCRNAIRGRSIPTLDDESRVRDALKIFCELSERLGEAEARCQLGDILRSQDKRSNALREFSASKEIMMRQELSEEREYWVSVLAVLLVKEKELTGTYDCFLSYNSKDKEAVLCIAQTLKGVGLRPWFDEWDMIGDKPWMRQLEEALRLVNCTAFFVGPNGTGPWQERERLAALSAAVKTNRGIVVVLLPDAPEVPEDLPLFLQDYPMIRLADAAKAGPQSLNNLVLGIMGERPGDFKERSADAVLVAEVQMRKLYESSSERSIFPEQ